MGVCANSVYVSHSPKILKKQSAFGCRINNNLHWSSAKKIITTLYSLLSKRTAPLIITDMTKIQASDNPLFGTLGELNGIVILEGEPQEELSDFLADINKLNEEPVRTPPEWKQRENRSVLKQVNRRKQIEEARKGLGY